MELLLLLIVVVGGAVLLFHPRTKDRQPMKSVREWAVRTWKEMTSPKPPVPQPASDEKEVIAGGTTPGNVPRQPSETGKQPPEKGRHSFPDTPEPATRFEDFNRLLFTYVRSEERRWDPTRVSDFPTRITGEEDWLVDEIKKRLRPARPVLVDPFGLWANASEQLEMDPASDNPIISAYLALPIEIRPIVVSYWQALGGKTNPPPDAFICHRYGFVDLRFNRKFADDYPADVLQGLMEAMTGPEEEWETFSAARLRKSVLETNREEESHRQAMAAYRHKNRFAALWNLRDDDLAGEETDADKSETEAAQ